ncbi:hypothetical protein BKA61DRAFT_623239 [Leptodontidium sp. MPI-SDFR-AT-0119]|nr:hypothetical protein BKA61DRAFT_623239 [Leptodontidium sp. MPI-SDFR-AT-0119]
MFPNPTPIPYDTNGKVPKSRSRLGCLTCRRRRLKCDEVGPTCGNCIALDRSCVWGIKASFHTSRMRCLSERESASISALRANLQPPLSWKFINSTEEIKSCYQNSQESPPMEPNDVDEIIEDISSIDTSSQNSLRSGPSANRTSSDNPRAADYAGLPFSIDALLNSTVTFTDIQTSNVPRLRQEPGPSVRSISFLSSLDGFEDSPRPFSQSIAALPSRAKKGARGMPSWPIGERKKALLLTAYLRETATWCETTDSLRHFSLQTSRGLLESQAYSAAAVAVASRQIDNTTGDARTETIELYDFARETICSLEAWQNDHMVLAGALQLCVYCMMSMEVHEWRLHLRGCAGTFQEMGWNGLSEGLSAACFWAFARIDIWAAYLIKQPTLIPTNFWVPSNYDISEARMPPQDRHSNQAIWIFARIINELSEIGKIERETVNPVQPRTIDVFANLWKELTAWREECPVSVEALVELPPVGEDPFPMIIFGNQSAICGNIFYHTGCILLLENGIGQPYVVDRNKELEWHALQIGGISTSTDSHANLVNNLQPLFIAARYFHKPSEQIALLRHLKHIEKSTGWKTGSRSAELRELWGFG